MCCFLNANVQSKLVLTQASVSLAIVVIEKGVLVAQPGFGEKKTRRLIAVGEFVWCAGEIGGRRLVGCSVDQCCVA